MSKTKYKYFLKLTTRELTTKNGFKWKETGLVSCKDWSKQPTCGQGLHAFGADRIDIETIPYHLRTQPLLYLTIKAPEKLCINLNGKWKFPYCHVLETNTNPFNALRSLRNYSEEWCKYIIHNYNYRCAINFYSQSCADFLSDDIPAFNYIKNGCIVNYCGQDSFVVDGSEYKCPKLQYHSAYKIHLINQEIKAIHII